jgi:DNA-binding PadR family transcriptional regulator
MARQTTSIAEMLPLREPTFYILLSLSQERKHGYAVLLEVEALSNGRVRLSTGTLYGALGRLLTQGLVERAGQDPEDTLEDELDLPGSTRQRKYYQLTQFGRRVLEAEVARLQGLLSAARSRLGDSPL